MEDILHVGYMCKMLYNDAKKLTCVDKKFWVRAQFSEKWVTEVKSETANDTKMPMIPKDALEAWAVQPHFLIPDTSDLHGMAAIWKTWGLTF